MNKKTLSIGFYAYMIFAFALYSTTGIFSKNASFHRFMSWPYILNFTGLIVVLFIYALMWQNILKRLPLNVAFMWKSTGLFFSLLYSHYIFNEEITLNNILGISIIFSGLIIISWKK